MIEQTGRYYVKDQATGRTFCVEPLSDRSEKLTDKIFKNGGYDTTSEKNKSQPLGGSIYEEDSIITEENGFKNIGISQNPADYIEKLLSNVKI